MAGEIHVTPRARLHTCAAALLGVLAFSLSLPQFVPGESNRKSSAEATNPWVYDDKAPLVLSKEESAESYVIYSSLLQQEMPDWDLKRYAIEEWTQDMRSNPAESLCLKPEKEQEALYRQQFDDYLKKNRSRHRLESRFLLHDYLMIPPERVEHLKGLFFETQPWSEDDREAYHDINVIFTVSEVGFNRDHTRAIVYIGHYCGGLCGGGTYHLLIKRDGKWQSDAGYRGEACAWVS